MAKKKWWIIDACYKGSCKRIGRTHATRSQIEKELGGVALIDEKEMSGHVEVNVSALKAKREKRKQKK